MDELEIECNECGWQGLAFDLLAKTNKLDDRNFIYCPDCAGKDISDIDEDD